MKIDWNGIIKLGMWLCFVLGVLVIATVYDHINP